MTDVQVKLAKQRPNPASAISAAISRIYPNICDAELAREVAWACAEVRWSKRNSIAWTAMPLGQLLRARLAEAQNWRCCYCGSVLCLGSRAPDKAATIEHVVRLIDGGEDHPDNMAIACEACNNQRSR